MVGTDRRISLFEVAERAKEMTQRGEIAEDLDTKATTETPQTFPNGCHVAEVEIDRDTGSDQDRRLCAVDDAGNMLNHMLVEGQWFGGLAQGLGQALIENAVYDAEWTAGLRLVHGLRHAARHRHARIAEAVISIPQPPIRSASRASAKRHDRRSIAAIMNAVADAISGTPGRWLDMPATPEKLWTACGP